MAKLGLVGHTVHCRNEEPKRCAGEFSDYIRKRLSEKKIALVGYQLSILEALYAFWISIPRISVRSAAA